MTASPFTPEQEARIREIAGEGARKAQATPALASIVVKNSAEMSRYIAQVSQGAIPGRTA